jgi:hypothetical protein
MPDKIDESTGTLLLINLHLSAILRYPDICLWLSITDGTAPRITQCTSPSRLCLSLCRGAGVLSIGFSFRFRFGNVFFRFTAMSATVVPLCKLK